MIKPQAPENEIERLEALIRYDILDTPPEKEYDDIARICAYLMNVPVAMISFIDGTRKWYKAVVGVDSEEMPRDIAVCAHTMVYDDEIMIVEDTRNDPRFIDSPATQGKTPTIFYAGVKLVNPDGFVLGTLCAVDHKPNKISKEQAEILVSLGNQVMNLLERRRNNILLREVKLQLETRYEELEKFSYAVAHDINSPINSMISIAQLLTEHPPSRQEAKKYLTQMIDSGYKLTEYVNDILTYYKSQKDTGIEKESVSIHAVLEKIETLLDPEGKCTFCIPEKDAVVTVRAVVLDQLLINLIKNSIKHCDKEVPVIQVKVEETDTCYTFEVIDNGPGIAEKDREKIFDFLVTVKNQKTSGSGIGLAIVKQIIEREGGRISVRSNEEEGTIFQFSLSK